MLSNGTSTTTRWCLWGHSRSPKLSWKITLIGKPILVSTWGSWCLLCSCRLCTLSKSGKLCVKLFLIGNLLWALSMCIAVLLYQVILWIGFLPCKLYVVRVLIGCSWTNQFAKHDKYMIMTHHGPQARHEYFKARAASRAAYSLAGEHDQDIVHMHWRGHISCRHDSLKDT